MKRRINIIYLAAVAFIGLNTYFYVSIYRQQLAFQSDLLARQTNLCCNTLERVGQSFENDLNAIPFADDFSQLFQDEQIMQQGSQNLQKLFTRYAELIDKITVTDNHRNVYSLILDRHGNIVSDYYESQRQASLLERDQLYKTGDKYIYIIPDFDDEGIMRSNISVEINYAKFVNSVFEQYGLRDILWQALISEEGRMITSGNNQLSIPDEDLETISDHLSEENHGSLTHTIMVDSVSTKVVSVYYPVWLLKRNLGVIFSIKSDLFLRSILTKMIAVTISSLLILLVGIIVQYRLYIRKNRKQSHSSQLKPAPDSTLDPLPLGLLMVGKDGIIHYFNRTAKSLIWEDTDPPGSPEYDSLPAGPMVPGPAAGQYLQAWGPGSLLVLYGPGDQKFLYRQEWPVAGDDKIAKAVLLIDITSMEAAQNLARLSHDQRSDLIRNAGKEIQASLQELQRRIIDLSERGTDPGQQQLIDQLKKDAAMLAGHLNTLQESALREADEFAVKEEPFFLRETVDLALDPIRESAGNGVSLITKIRNEVPDHLIGDPEGLRRVLNMLAGNAMHLTREGRVLIAATVMQEQTNRLQIQFHVEDTGSAIPEEIVQRYRQAAGIPIFYQTRGVHEMERTLQEARKQVELLKGSLLIESPSSISTDPDQPGNRFVFTMEVFPVYSRKMDASHKDITRIRDIRCLVFSQDREADESKIKVFRNAGLEIRYMIYRIENIDSAVSLMREKSRGTDIIMLTDDESHSGLLLLSQAWELEELRDRLVIFITSAHQHAKMKTCRAFAVDYYLGSPIEPARLQQILAHHFPGLPAEELKKISSDQ